MGENDTNPSGVQMPEDLTSLNDQGLTTLRDKVQKAFDKINAKERIAPEDLAAMNSLADQMDAIKGEETTRATAQAEAQAQRESLTSRMSGEVAEEAAEGEAAEEAPVEVPSIQEVTGDPEGGEVEATEALAASAAGAKRLPGRRAPATATPRPTPSTEVTPRGDNVSIVASSDLPGIPTGKTLDRDGLSEALHARARLMSDGSPRALVASIVNDAPKNDVSKVTTDEGIRKAWANAHDVESMTASGGWCAPSETVYDFVCDYEALPDTLDLPSITSTRGGLRYPTSPLLADVFDGIDSGFTWTEDDDIAAAQPGGPTKPCFTIPCPDLEEVRLQAQGICVTAGNLTDRAYPELTNRYVDLVMTAHAHRMNALTIAKVVAASTTVTPTVDADLGAAESLWGVAEFIVNQFRDVFFAGEDFMLEGVLPRWSRAVVRRDLARRNGVEPGNVSNAEIASAFAEIGARIQFVSNWQPLTAAATAYPQNVDMLLYPAGAHTRLDGGSLDLGVVRDSTLNATNDYTAAWTEEFWNVASRCASYVTTVPVCANGHTGLQTDFTCPTV